MTEMVRSGHLSTPPRGRFFLYEEVFYLMLRALYCGLFGYIRGRAVQRREGFLAEADPRSVNKMQERREKGPGISGSVLQGCTDKTRTKERQNAFFTGFCIIKKKQEIKKYYKFITWVVRCSPMTVIAWSTGWTPRDWSCPRKRRPW